MSKNLFAYTAPGSNYPTFISVNKTEGGGVEIIIRAEANADGSCGDMVSITLTQEQAANIGRELSPAEGLHEHLVRLRNS